MTTKFKAKFTVKDIRNRFRLELHHIESFVDLGILLPDRWKEFNFGRRQSIIANGFTDVLWHVEEVIRFEGIVRLILRTQTLQVAELINLYKDVQDTVTRMTTEMAYRERNLTKSMMSLEASVRSRDEWYTLKEFSTIINRPKQTLNNNITPEGILTLSGYEGLIFQKVKNRWVIRKELWENYKRKLPVERITELNRLEKFNI
jgi:hypothetical protein